MKLSEILRIAKARGMLVRIEFKYLVWASRNYVFGYATDTNVRDFAWFHRDTKWNVEFRGGNVIHVSNPDF